MPAKLRSIAALVILSALAACGGGGDDGGTSAGTAPPGGVIVAPTPAIVGFAFGGSNFFALSLEQRRILAAAPVVEVTPRLVPGVVAPAILSFSEDANGNGAGLISVICESRSRCSTDPLTDIQSVELSDSTQLYLCNGGSPGNAREVSLCSSTVAFNDAEVTLRHRDGRIFKKTIRYRAAAT